ncbi:MAG: biotin--[acetyl-CoA-carboxylase] ligase, partial [Brachybacterium tyrofermentans]
CLTLGQEVRIDPLGTAGAEGARPPSLYGRARAVDDRGRLLVDLPDGERVPVDVGDVRHVRPGGTVRTTTDAVQGVEQEDSSR